MKKAILVILVLMFAACDGGGAEKQPYPRPSPPGPTPIVGAWAWVSGGAEGNELPVYTVPRQLSDAASPGGLAAAMGVADARGSLWLFGGAGMSTPMYRNTVWKYYPEPEYNRWAYYSGDNSPADYAAGIPGGRVFAQTWIDAAGNIWIYGGQGYDSTGETGLLADMWLYRTTPGAWSWQAGSDTIGTPRYYADAGDPANTPGARYGAATWVDAAGYLWLYGGANNSIRYADLWRFNPATLTWDYITGAAYSANPVYGILGVPDSDNWPGARAGGAVWTDAAGNVWLYGGFSGSTKYADLWRWDGELWTWEAGPAGGNPPPGNYPGPRDYAVSFGRADEDGNLWLYGEDGYADLWRYDTTQREWVYVQGPTARYAPTVRGEQGLIGDLANTPGGRTWPIGWMDAEGDLWLYGGISHTGNAFMGDLWRYKR